MADGEKAINFLKKSTENRSVSMHARENEQLNASASRYYYALRQALVALFEKRGLPVPKDFPVFDRITRKTEMKQNPFPDQWHRISLHNEAPRRLRKYPGDLKRILEDAWELRLKGDYKELDVAPTELNCLISDADVIFTLIEGEINGSG